MSLMSYEKGLEILLTSILPYEKVEKIALTECLGRILARDIGARDDYPAFATASMDGYAVRFAEQENALKIIGSVPAGTFPKYSPKENECVKTFTGSLMSANLDTLVPVESKSKSAARLCGAWRWRELQKGRNFAQKRHKAWF